MPILRTIYKNTFEQQKPFFIDVLDSIEKLVISQDADPETAMETIENDWAEKLLRRCLKTSNNVTNKNTTKQHLLYSMEASKSYKNYHVNYYQDI